MRDIYVTSIIELIEAGSDVDSVLKNLKAVLESRGHEKILPKILKRTASKLEERTEKTTATVTVRAETDAEKYKEQIDRALRYLKAEIEPRVHVDETLVGGFIAEHKNMRIDQSYKNALLKTYQKVTN